MSFTIQKLKEIGNKQGLPSVFIDSVYFLNNSLDNLVKNIENNPFHHLRQEFNANVLDLHKKKGFFPYDYWDNFEKFKKVLPSKD